jgi:hypothetical protein
MQSPAYGVNSRAKEMSKPVEHVIDPSVVLLIRESPLLRNLPWFSVGSFPGLQTNPHCVSKCYRHNLAKPEGGP